MEDVVYLIAASCLVLLFIIYLLTVIVHLNKERSNSETNFSLQKDRLLNNYREQLKTNELNDNRKKYIGQKIIGICPERMNPIIGICMNYEYEYTTSKEYPLIRDYVTNEEVLFKGKLIIYSEMVFNALYKLNNEDRIALLEIKKDSLLLSSGHTRGLTKYEIKEILEKNNFYN